MDEKNQKLDKANKRLALVLGVIAILAMLTTMYALSGAKIPT